ncbi:MFS transporter [Buchananella hordeovulneris]|uniref:MFS transporter n=1 Tax=Buchananella hordeovulneris TaxID=52770 RepID=UPI000F5F81B8|nr:MFS transporter [Buchananella hordeovulneris]RRD52722.1 MFS transporter [Buchananella hordeovulneris]
MTNQRPTSAPSPAGEAAPTWRTLWSTRGFRLLIGVRLASQSGDGLLQAGLATLFFFRPESMRSPGGVAFALAVLLLPYSLVGPFVGAVLDRVSRRNLLVYGNLGRCLGMGLLVVALAAARSGGSGAGRLAAEVALYTLALAALGVMHFLLAALSAGVPLIIPRRSLLLANAILPPVGGVATAVGAVIGFALRIALPPGLVTDLGAVAAAGIMFGLAALLAARLGVHEIGPVPAEGVVGAGSEQDGAAARVDGRHAQAGGAAEAGGHEAADEAGAERLTAGGGAGAGAGSTAGGAGGLRRAVRSTWRELAHAAAHLWQRRLPAIAIATMGAHRATYGVAFLTIVLASRTILAPADGDGVGVFSLLLACIIGGHGIGVLLTGLRARVGARTWLTVCLGLSVLGLSVVALAPRLPTMAVGLVVHGIGLQAGKITVDTVVHGHVADAYRGRAFAIHDSVFNGSEVVAAALLCGVIPVTGWSRAILLGAAAWLGLCALAWRRATAAWQDELAG